LRLSRDSIRSNPSFTRIRHTNATAARRSRRTQHGIVPSQAGRVAGVWLRAITEDLRHPLSHWFHKGIGRKIRKKRRKARRQSGFGKVGVCSEAGGEFADWQAKNETPDGLIRHSDAFGWYVLRERLRKWMQESGDSWAALDAQWRAVIGAAVRSRGGITRHGARSDGARVFYYSS
jgi:hypothetical protein